MPMGLRVLIVDDEPLARRGIRAELQAFTDITILEDCKDGASAIEAICAHSPDLIFLDVQMPGLSGFDVARRLPTDRMPLIIFLTAHEKYALEAFEVHALDYLLKPINTNRFVEAVKRAQQQIKTAVAGELEDRLRGLFGDPHPYIERFAVRMGNRVVFVLADEIEWIQANGEYVTLHVGKRVSLLRESLNSVETRLDPSKFVRIHRSAIVQTARILELQRLPNRELRLILIDGTRLRVSRTYRSHFDRWLSRVSQLSDLKI